MTFTLSSVAARAGSTPDELRRLADVVDRGERYETRRIRVRRRNRTLFLPDTVYDATLKQLRSALESLCDYAPPQHVYGFVKGRSTRQNAANHLAAECVLTIDLMDFFPSIGRESIFSALKAAGADEDAAQTLSRIAAPRGSLGMGLSTSPMLSNLVFLPTDLELAAYAAEQELNFTRYVDDLTFSGVIDDRNADAIREILTNRGWVPNEHKTRFMRRGRAQYVTGLSVTDPAAPHAPRRLKRRMRWRLNMIEKYGFSVYLTHFGGNARGHDAEQLRGLAQYIASIEPGLRGAWLERWYHAVPTTSSRGGQESAVLELDVHAIQRLLEGDNQIR